MKKLFVILILITACTTPGVNPYQFENAPEITEIEKDGEAFYVHFEMPENGLQPNYFKVYVNEQDINLIVNESPAVVTEKLISTKVPRWYLENCFEIESVYNSNSYKSLYHCK